MSVIGRGARNAFRNSIRTVSIIAILSLAIALAVVMLLSTKAVDAKIKSVKGSVGNTITVTPAGTRGFAGGGNPLTSANVTTIKTTPHVASTVTSLEGRVSTTGSATFGGGANTNSNATTNLVSAISPGSLGRVFGGGTGGGGGSGVSVPANFSLPITVTGTTAPTSTTASGVSNFTITSGATIDGSGSQDVALVGTALATKNNLSVGSTFTAYGQTITVSGIYDTGNTFSDGGIILPLATLQTLSGVDGVTTVYVTVDSVDNLASTTTAIQNRLGTSVADVVSDTTTTATTVSSLDNIRTIALYSLIGALVSGAVIILLNMVMIVRERRREIGVLKAIGSSNGKISLQFVSEALTLTLASAVIGVLIGIVLANPVLNVLVNNASSGNTSAAAASTGGRPGFPGAGGFPGGGTGAGRGAFRNAGFGNLGRGITNIGSTLSHLSTTVGFGVILDGLVVAIAIAILGSALPSFLIAKVRPAEVMRVE